MKYSDKNKAINVWLPNKLFSALREKIEEQQKQKESTKLQLAQAAYLLNLVIYMPVKHRDEYRDGYVPICSEAHKNFKHFSKYMKFLVNNDFLKQHEKNYSTATKTCKKYTLPYKYQKQVIRYTKIEGHQRFISKRNDGLRERMENADKTTLHLTKWLKPERFKIEYDLALEYVKSTYGNDKNAMDKRNCRIITADSIHNHDWSYSREGKDNRLHSILTYLPKDLRPYLSYDQKKLVSLDIKNSQPFIFSAILNNLITLDHQDYDIKERIIRRMLTTDNMPNMFDYIDQSLCRRGLKVFVDEVVNGKFYEKYGEILYHEDVLTRNNSGQYFFVEYQSSINRMICHEYDTIRDAAKHIIMKTLFCSKKYRHDIVDVFQKSYPKVFHVMQRIKRDDDKAFFPILLQNIEADCVLDYCTKKISKKFPDVPLFTIHDSIVTTEDNSQLVEWEFTKHLKTYFGLLPKLQKEHWSLYLNHAA